MKLKKSEAILALVNFMCVKLFITAPQSLVRIGKNAAWLLFLLHTLVMTLAFLLVYWLWKRSGKKELITMLPTGIRACAGLLIALYLILSSSLTGNLLIRGVIRTFMSESPSLMIAAFILIPAGYGAKKGVEKNARLSLVFAPLLFLLVLVPIVLIPYYDYSNLWPILGDNRFYPAAFFGFDFFSDFIFFYLLLPYINKDEAFSVGISSLLITGGLGLVFLIADILAIPPEVSYFSPYYQMITFMAGSTSSLSWIKFFKLIFLLNFFLYYSTAIALSVDILQKSFRLKSDRLSGIFVLITSLAVMLWKNPLLVEIYEGVMAWSVLIFPLLPLFSYLVYGRKKP